MSISKEELRRNQTREVLDYDKNIRKIVFERQKKAQAGFDDNAKPKTQRDMEAEISVEKGLEQMKIVLNKKVQQLDLFISNLGAFKGYADEKKSTTKSEKSRDTLATITNYGDVLTAYNSIVRAYTKQGLSDTSKMIIQTKFQEIDPDLKALIFGMNEVLNYLFGDTSNNINNRLDKSVFNILHSLSVYRCIADQLKVNKYKVIENIDMETSFKQILSEMSETRRKMIMQYQKLNPSVAFDRSVALRNYPIIGDDISSRLDALENELGVKIPDRDDIEEKLENIPYKDVDDVINKLRSNAEADIDIGTREQKIKDYDKRREDIDREIDRLLTVENPQLKNVSKDIKNKLEKHFSDIRLFNDALQNSEERLAKLREEYKGRKGEIREHKKDKYDRINKLQEEIYKYDAEIVRLSNIKGVHKVGLLKQIKAYKRYIKELQKQIVEIENEAKPSSGIYRPTYEIRGEIDKVYKQIDTFNKLIDSEYSALAVLNEDYNLVVEQVNSNKITINDAIKEFNNLADEIKEGEYYLNKNKAQILAEMQNIQSSIDDMLKLNKQKVNPVRGFGKSIMGKGRHIISDDESEGEAGDESGDNTTDEEREELADDFIMEELKGTGKQIIYNDSRDDFYKVRKYNKH
jgi:hypothetical protein